MTQRTKWEEQALEAANEAGAELVEQMIEGGFGTDMNEWPDEAFPGFVASIVEAYVEKFQALAGSGEAPF